MTVSRSKLGVNKINCQSETIKIYLPLHSTKLPTPVATHEHHQSNYFVIMDKENIADDTTVEVSIKRRVADDATATLDKRVDEEFNDDANMS